MSLLSEVWGSQVSNNLDPKIAALLDQLTSVLGGFEILPMKLNAHDIYSCTKFINPSDMFNGLGMKPVYRDLIVNSINRNTRNTRVSCRALSNSDINQLGLAQNKQIEYFLLSNEAVSPAERKLFCIQPTVNFIMEINMGK